MLVSLAAFSCDSPPVDLQDSPAGASTSFDGIQNNQTSFTAARSYDKKTIVWNSTIPGSGLTYMGGFGGGFYYQIFRDAEAPDASSSSSLFRFNHLYFNVRSQAVGAYDNGDGKTDIRYYDDQGMLYEADATIAETYVTINVESDMNGIIGCSFKACLFSFGNNDFVNINGVMKSTKY